MSFSSTLCRRLASLVLFTLLAPAMLPAHASTLLVVGNSLTQHGPAPDLGWTGVWGMAASSADKDYVHRLAVRLGQGQARKVEVTIIAGYPLEKGLLADQPPPSPVPTTPMYDDIVIEIGDNVDFRSPRSALFAQRYNSLVSELVQALRPQGKLVCLGRWWADGKADEAIRAACNGHGGTFVALAPISAQAGAHAQQERSFSNRGVGEHPGDQGMSEIADRVFCALRACKTPSPSVGAHPDIGAYYFPGWHSKSRYWKDVKGLADSRSPGRPWPEREPLLGFYAEEDPKVAQQHIEWASQYGIDFFAYDWYWDGKQTYLNHALGNYLKAPNQAKLRFSLLWANHSEIPRSLVEFDAMVAYWLTNYLTQPQFYKLEGKPVIFIYSNTQLDLNAQKFGSSATALLERAQVAARNQGLPGLFFVSSTNRQPDDNLELALRSQGFSAHTGWNYVAAQDKRQVADYSSMVDTYLNIYAAVTARSGKLPYIVPVSPGWDARPWEGEKAVARTESTPEKFQRMLDGARRLIDSNASNVMSVVMIEAWNEFGEGAYIEPTKKWQFEYLRRIQQSLK